MKDIPIHQLQDRVSSGLDIWYFAAKDVPREKASQLGAHRDDHYIFFLLETGAASLMIDFEEIHLPESSLYYILPGQVHHRINAETAQGWFIAIDTLLIPPDYRDVFESALLLQQPYGLSDKQLTQCNNLLHLADDKYKAEEQAPFNLPVVHSLMQSFIGIVAGCYSNIQGTNQNLSRPAQLSQQFKKLLTQHFGTVKSPSAYAGMLNVSESYLNEVLKKVTGFSVSYWIHQEVVLEARRLLYYSQCNVKEITHKLGYDDPAYFSRLFKNVTGKTPLEFRADYRK
jgi:AraC family transcriptional activator of pobA